VLSLRRLAASLAAVHQRAIRIGRAIRYPEDALISNREHAGSEQ
jgi:hypothetical protein